MSAARVRSAPPGTEPVGQVPEAERLARVALSCAVEPGDGTTSSLIRQMGAERALAKAQSATEGEAGEMLAQRLAEIDPVRQLEQAARCGIRFLVPGDPEWPTSLDELDDAITVEGFGGTPPGLWVKGPMPLTELATSVAVVGSRAASVYGVETGPRGVRAPRALGCAGRLGRGTRHRLRGSQRHAVRRRRHGRGPGLRGGPGLSPSRTDPCSSTSPPSSPSCPSNRPRRRRRDRDSWRATG